MNNQLLLPGIAFASAGAGQFTLPVMKGDVRAIITKHCGRAMNDWRPAVHAHYANENYSGFSLKRADARGCIFVDCNFESVAANGSAWRDCTFERCNLSQGIFQNGIFDGSTFQVPTVIGAGFSGASFKGTTFTGGLVRGAAFSYCDFTGANFSELDIAWATFEGATFDDADLGAIDFSDTNLEYADLRYAKMAGVRISLQQFPFIFGTRSDLIESGAICISTEDNSYPDRRLPWDAVRELIPVLIEYYRRGHNWFPQANLCLLSNQEDVALRLIEEGIRECISGKRYVELKQLCKLLAISNLFEAAELRSTYINLASMQAETNGDDRAYALHDGEIRSYLMPMPLAGRVVVSFTLANDAGSVDALSEVLPVLDSALRSVGLRLSWSRLESHVNSPNNVIIVIGEDNLVYASPPPAAEHGAYAKVMLMLTALGTLFGGLSWYDGTTKRDPQPNIKVPECHNIEFQNVTVIHNSQTYLITLPNGQVVPTDALKTLIKKRLQ